MSVEADDAPAEPRTGALHETSVALRSVFRHPALRRVQFALAGSMIGDWAYATAVTVWAYDVGGAKAVGLWGAVRYLLMAFSAPFTASLADRLPRKQVMIASDLIRSAFVVAAAACIAADTPAAPIFILATATSILGSVFRPAQMAWMPSLVDRPEELTASNAVSSTIESVAFFAGPALGAALVALTNVEVVFLVNGATYVLSAVLILSIRAKAVEQTDGAADEPEDEGALAQMFAGFTEVWRNKDLLLVAYLLAAQTVVAGASSVFFVLFAVDILDTGAQGFGYVTAALGVGAVAGGFFALGRASKNRLASDLAVGTFLWAAPLLLVVAWPSPATVFAAALLMGFANPLVDVNFVTIVQRITPEQTLGRVFGAFEGIAIGTMAIGAGVFPFAVEWVGLRTSLAIVGIVVGAPIVLFVGLVRSLDTRLGEPDGLPLLRSLPIFAPLAPSVVDRLARQLARVPVKAGTEIVTEGEESDQFYVISSGGVDVTQGNRSLRHEGPGEFFGEIGLLRDVPRTATVTATEDTVLLTLGRTEFLNAVTGNEESSTLLDDVVNYRLRF